ncbi:metallophosphoesterase [Psittacicella hinzii]|uniref:Calcineurin-like phosphoesterase domain-containing protein n=1 Tax=Psittacicella hinzii TaxID=2028575 RepID=A0A3A1YS12_9GAMM|nr:metallophosphoesterase [Psittacicella hinzii]RIY39998.1 hypothetical protein CKF58_01145 [Psittacicella hinzii]
MQLESFKILHISGHHLLPEAQCLFAGIAPYSCLQAVLEHAAQTSVKLDLTYDAIVCTGDIVHDVVSSHDHLADAYELFIQALRSQYPQTPVYLCPGNHDPLDLFAQLVQHAHFEPAKLVAQVNQAVVINLNQYWNLILLNSQLPTQVGGELTQEQCTFIQELVVSQPDKHVLLALHHNPLPTGCAWLDSYDFKGVDKFWQKVQALEAIKGIVHGHIHQDIISMVGNTKVMAVPATSIQFKPHAVDFALDELAPGYRILSLEANGTIEQQLYRLDVVPSVEPITGY